MSEKPVLDLTDEMLVAFIDDELDVAERQAVRESLARDPRAAARLDFLRGGDPSFAEAFDGLLAQAPMERLAAMAATTTARPVDRRDAARPDRRWLLAAACLVGGVALDRSVVLMRGAAAPSREQGWRDVVANYMMLYSAETLDRHGSGPAPAAPEMARLSTLLGVDVTLAKVELPGAAIRRAQVLTYEGAPLAQVAYLDPATGPVAFCFIRQAGRAEAPRIERRFGMALAYWSTPTHAFLVIGHGSDAATMATAETLRERVAA